MDIETDSIIADLKLVDVYEKYKMDLQSKTACEAELSTNICLTL